MKTCLFGGSFDPIHTGHTTIAESAWRECGLDRVVFLPANCSPFKTGKSTLFSGEERVAMLRAATKEMPWAEVSELDLTLPPPSWSWRIVEAWKQQHPADELYWLLGTDQWDELHRWGRYEYLCQELTFIVYHRKTQPQPREGVRSIFLQGEHPASASEIRHCLMGGESVPSGWLAPGVDSLCRQFLAARA